MKSTPAVLAVLCLFPAFSAGVFAQVTGDFRTTGAGLTGAQWSAVATWQRYNGSAWISAPSAPTGAGVITIQSADSVFIDAAVSITGTLRNQGKLGGTPGLTIAGGGTYEHAQNSGSIPVCTWATGSTCLVTGYVSGSKPSNSSQNFYNFRWNCTGQTANIDLAMNGNTIDGDFTVDSTGAVRVYLTSPTSYVFGNPITIGGNVVLNGGVFASNGSGSLDTIEVITKGNIIVNGGNFGVSRGSGPDVTWKLYGNMTVTNAVLQNSGGTHANKLVFAGIGVQNLTLTNVTYGGGSNYFTVEVQSGSTLNLGTSFISSSNTGSFLLLAGASLATGNPGGIDSTIRCTGASNGGGNAFNTAASYTFNGSAAQVTGLLMPATVDTLTINNAAGVTLSRTTTISRRLRLRAGVFNNTIPFTLGAGASVSFEGGSLLISTAVETPDGGTIPKSFFVDQNYPNPFNPSTTIRFGLPAAGFVSVKVLSILGQEVATLFEGRQDAGIHLLQFDASRLASGMYLCRVEASGSVDIKHLILMK
jgi:hypothetical protein